MERVDFVSSAVSISLSFGRSIRHSIVLSLSLSLSFFSSLFPYFPREANDKLEANCSLKNE